MAEFRFYCLNDQDHIVVGDNLDVLDLEAAIKGRLPGLSRASAFLVQSDRGLAGGKPPLHKQR
jgi:hypothetical protein